MRSQQLLSNTDVLDVFSSFRWGAELPLIHQKLASRVSRCTAPVICMAADNRVASASVENRFHPKHKHSSCFRRFMQIYTDGGDYFKFFLLHKRRTSHEPLYLILSYSCFLKWYRKPVMVLNIQPSQCDGRTVVTVNLMALSSDAFNLNHRQSEQILNIETTIWRNMHKPKSKNQNKSLQYPIKTLTALI